MIRHNANKQNFIPLRKALLCGLTIFCILVSNNTSLADDFLNLPELGDSTSSTVSRQKEYQVGQAWLMIYRSRIPTFKDPQLNDYLEDLLQQLARYSELEDKRLTLVTIDNKALNAFAVPGGVIGIQSGLLLHAKSEGELASVLSHELAHLSQRHWARRVEKSRQNMLPTMAALLASMILIATSGGDAGMAALTMTQAASAESQLRFSRDNEAEADRIGMKTLSAANFNPSDMPVMFERMLRSSRFMGQRPPEFLLSHPVTEKRISDTRNRAKNIIKKNKS